MPEIAERKDEVLALGRLGVEELGKAVVGVAGIQRAVADRVFGLMGPIAAVTRHTYGFVSDGVESGLRGGAGVAARSAEGGLRRLPAGDGRPLSATAPGSALIAGINGLIGDSLEREQSVLQAPMAVRVNGEIVPLERDAITATFPAATPLPVVFVHGLMGDEFAWRLGGEPYGERLARELGCTPVYVRYNSGRHVSENGRSLADLLAGLTAAWPVEIERLALVGHSMGGLVARSACHQGALEDAPWTRNVRHVVSLGTPHMGAPLEQGVHYLSAALNALPETRPFGAFLQRRSAGIRDLRQGSLVDADWRDLDPDALRAVACEEVPLLEGATHCFVAATVTRSDRHPIGRLLGDWLVLSPSASGRSRRRTIPFSSSWSTACTSAALTTSRCSTTRRSTSGCATGWTPARSGRCPPGRPSARRPRPTRTGRPRRDLRAGGRHWKARSRLASLAIPRFPSRTTESRYAARARLGTRGMDLQYLSTRPRRR